MMVLGVDPGRNMGVAVIVQNGNGLHLLKVKLLKDKSNTPFNKRLCVLWQGLSEFSCLAIDAVAIEDVHVEEGARKNFKTVLRISELVGMVKAKFGQEDITTYEYKASLVKKAVGCPKGDKSQVAFMVSQILKIDPKKYSDHETDAMAVAICHLNRLNKEKLCVKK